MDFPGVETKPNSTMGYAMKNVQKDTLVLVGHALEIALILSPILVGKYVQAIKICALGNG